MSTKSVQNAHMSAQLRDLHGSLVEIVGVMNRPQRDEAMVREAGISLDRALFPLLVLVERLGPIGVVELAGPEALGWPSGRRAFHRRSWLYESP